MLNISDIAHKKVADFSSEKIKSIVNQLFLDTMLDMGADMDDNLVQHSVTRIADRVYTAYKEFNISELKGAFDRGIEGEFGDYRKLNAQVIYTWLQKEREIIRKRYKETAEIAQRQIDVAIDTNNALYKNRSFYKVHLMLRYGFISYDSLNETSILQYAEAAFRGEYDLKIEEIEVKKVKHIKGPKRLSDLL